MKKQLKSAFAVHAEGERYIGYRDNLVKALGKYAPDIPVVLIDAEKSDAFLKTVRPEERSYFRRLTIPLLDDFKGYDRVVWIDADADVTSERFADILSVNTSADGLAAAKDNGQNSHKQQMKARDRNWNAKIYFNSGVLVIDLCKIDRKAWRNRLETGLAAHAENPFKYPDQDLLNLFFDLREIDGRFNWIWNRGVNPDDGAWLIHYANTIGHDHLDELLSLRDEFGGQKTTWRDRCVVVSPRHAFIRPWIRAYFASGNTTPLVIVPGPPGDWQGDDMAYCTAAAEFSGGCILDCSEEWRDSRRLASRAVRARQIGWFTKKSILHAVATRLQPKAWAWIDDDAEVTGTLDECFAAAARAPGFIFTQFYYPGSVSNRHPDRMYRSNIDTGDKICWNSLVFFHGDANARLAEELCKDFPQEDDEIIFGNLYKNNPAWHEGFCDFSIRNWQRNCKLIAQIPASWNGKLLHYTSSKNGGEIKKMWADKANRLPQAPFERSEKEKEPEKIADDGPVDAVFVIGTGSIDGNEELRFALRNLERHCPFVRDVYICGFCPSWVDRTSVKHLNWPDRFTHAKDANIIDKLRHACEQPGIAKRILFCSDDQFQTKVCTWDDFAPRYLRRYASNDGWYEARKRVWHSRLRKTLEREVQRRRASGLDANEVFYYQPHIWMPIDRDIFIDYARWCDYAHRDDTIIASGYFNFAGVKGRPDYEHVFIGNNVNTVPQATHVAYHDGSYKAAIQLLRGLFPQKSRFESSVGAAQARAVQNTPARPRVQPVTAVPEGSEDDPSPASPEEMAEILPVIARIRENPVWHGLLGDVSRAEELRLFGVHGWRIVWRDLLARWRESTCNGTDAVQVKQPRSDEAAAVIHAYIQNPEALRTVRFGPQNVAAPTKVWFQGRQVVRPASNEERSSLRERVWSSLRRGATL